METFFPPPAKPYSPYAPIGALPRHRRLDRLSFETGLGRSCPSESADSELEIARIAKQLALVARNVPWERVQNDGWDRLCPYIFRTRTAARIRHCSDAIAIQQGFDRSAFVNYALRRWYCFWGARIAEGLFVSHPGVAPGPPKDRRVDFTIDGIPFDLQTSDVPRAFSQRLADIHTQPEPIAAWLYAHQSREGRYHLENRLFLILCDALHPDEAWRLRADVGALRGAIDAFLARRKFIELWVADASGARRRVLTGVIPVVRTPGPRQLTLALPPPPAVEPPSLTSADEEPSEFQLVLPLL